ncbi:hypothetical protein J2W50_001985 [Herbaspirillum frisingense]|uniref:Uncharacterized protein n=1 Tax=Herbaspirillum frisingense TaxID=92645 RepID=A0ABU1PE65_9BURK|nr:hypothetical protein [Herbaspirillum frisingense]
MCTSKEECAMMVRVSGTPLSRVTVSRKAFTLSPPALQRSQRGQR